MTDSMTGKERAQWRAKANSLEPLFQVGKGGVSDALIAQTNDALKAKELIKLKVLLETSPQPPKEVAAQIAEATGAHVIQVIGGSMVFYKHNPELHKKKPVKKAVKKGVKRISKVKIAKNKNSKSFYKNGDSPDSRSSFYGDDDNKSGDKKSFHNRNNNRTGYKKK